MVFLMLNLKYIEVFQLVVNLGSYTSAAKVLGVSQPSISKTIAYIEQRLGIKLFEKFGNQLIPTPAAIKLLPHSERVMNRIEDTLSTLETLKRESQIRIAAAPSYSLGIFPLVIPEFSQHFPNTQLQIHTMTSSSMIAALSEGRVDIGIAVGSSIQPNMHDEVLGHDRIILLAPIGHPLASFKSISIESLSMHRFISIPPSHPVGIKLASLFEQEKRELKPYMIADAFELGINLCERGVAPALVGRLSALQADTSKTTIVEIEPKLTFTVVLRRRANTQVLKSTEAFTELFKAILIEQGLTC